MVMPGESWPEIRANVKRNLNMAVLHGIETKNADFIEQLRKEDKFAGLHYFTEIEGGSGESIEF